MLLIAKNSSDELVAAHLANRTESYTCLECSTPLRLRGGRHRRLHFYHTSKQRPCRQQGKSATHLAVQTTILKRLPAHEAMLEHPFPEIGRICDLYWEREKIAFEVQCSPISRDEVASRTADYHSLGIDVVWIFHERRFNRRRLSAAEEWLFNRSHYFTNINEQGAGVIYDQWARLQKGMRLDRTSRFAIRIDRPYRNPTISQEWPQPLKGQAKHRTIRFEGDVIDRLARGNSRLLDWSKGLIQSKRTSRWEGVKRTYNAFFRLVLETVTE